jgi:hypothetical protein
MPTSLNSRKVVPVSVPGRSQALIPEPHGGEGIPVKHGRLRPPRAAGGRPAGPGLGTTCPGGRRHTPAARGGHVLHPGRPGARSRRRRRRGGEPGRPPTAMRMSTSRGLRMCSASRAPTWWWSTGWGFEGWIERLVRVAGGRAEIVVASSGVVARRQGNAVDPHAWQDPRLLARYVDNLSTALARLRPDASASFAQRAEALRARLVSLDAMARQTLAAVPAAERRVIASHDAFGYLADAYGITFLSPRGWSTEAEPSAADIAALVRQVRRQRGAGPVRREHLRSPPDRAHRTRDRSAGRRRAVFGRAVGSGRAGRHRAQAGRAQPAHRDPGAGHPTRPLPGPPTLQERRNDLLEQGRRAHADAGREGRPRRGHFSPVRRWPRPRGRTRPTSMGWPGWTSR